MIIKIILDNKGGVPASGISAVPIRLWVELR